MTSKIDDGGPAFPNPALASDNFVSSSDVTGMSLRDWFAGQALAGVAAKCLTEAHAAGASPIDAVNLAAGLSYGMADAMLAARKQEHQQ